ncbi:MAG TPA: GNAT family N-acetyltransferase [Candidatus Nitrosotalea sp.]|nr:GNAT family N-acetyltransferase [Candidatus Nitrosotalea sp.]
MPEPSPKLLKVDVLPDLAVLDEARWNALLDSSRLPSVFLTWQWQTEWSQAFAADRPLQILTATCTDGTLAGLLPLYEEVPGRLRIIGGVDISDYLDVIARAGSEEDVWQALLQHRAGQPVEWDLHGIRAASPTATLLPALAPGSGLVATVERQDRCPVLPLPKSWDEYLARLSGKDRHELRRKIRRLERELPGATPRSHGDVAGWDEAMTRFLTLHRLSKVGKARFMDERMERFFRAATARLAAAGWARLWFLEHEGAAVAAFLCLEYAGSVGLYNSGFDPARAQLAPGIVLLAHVIADAIERGFPVFDFLRGEEPYKYGFGPAPEDVLNVRVAP